MRAARVPPSPFLRTIVVRVVLVWAFLKVLSAAGTASGGVPWADALAGSPVDGVLLIGVVVAALRIDMGRQSEIVFLANLGHSFGRVAVLAVGVCVLLEALLRSFLV